MHWSNWSYPRAEPFAFQHLTKIFKKYWGLKMESIINTSRTKSRFHLLFEKLFKQELSAIIERI